MSPTHSPKQTPWTPGPWTATLTIAEHDGMPACWQIDAEYHAICTTQFCYAQETEANAHLIAAAPELYEALKRLLDASDELDEASMPEEYAFARAALSKAKAPAEGGVS